MKRRWWNEWINVDVERMDGSVAMEPGDAVWGPCDACLEEPDELWWKR